MKIRERIPYLFKDQTKRAMVFKQNWYPLLNFPPDYQDFESQTYMSENNCVCALIGQLVIIPLYKKLIEVQSLENKSAILMPLLDETREWRDELFELFAEIRRMIEIGKIEKQFKIVSLGFNETLIPQPGRLPYVVKCYGIEYPFQYDIEYNIFEFFKWAESNSFLIPEELRNFYKGEDRNIKDQSVRRNDEKDEFERVFILESDVWFISFEGKKTRLKDSKPIRYVLEALKNPGKNLSFSKVVDIVSGLNSRHELSPDYKNMNSAQLEAEGLSEIVNKENEESEDIHKVFSALKEQYEKFKNGSKKDRAGLERGIEFFQREYGIKVFKTKDSLSMGRKRTNFGKKFDRDRSLITKAKNNVLKRTKDNLAELYDHFSLYLKIDNGLIYNPPRGSLPWIVMNSSNK